MRARSEERRGGEERASRSEAQFPEAWISWVNASYSAGGVVFTYHNATVLGVSVPSGPSSGGTVVGLATNMQASLMKQHQSPSTPTTGTIRLTTYKQFGAERMRRKSRPSKVKFKRSLLK